MSELPSASGSNESNEEDDGFKYIQDFDFLFKQLPSSSSTCEIVNVQPLDQSFLQGGGDASREMRSRQHLHYQVMRTFSDSNEFDEWWTHKSNQTGWIFNTIYKKKTDDEVHVYRCAHRNCSQRLRVVFVANCCDVRVEQALVEHTHGEKYVKVDSIKTLSDDAKLKISALESLGITATKIRRSLFKESINGMNVPTLKQIQNYIARIRTKRAPAQTESKPETPNSEQLNLGNKRKRGRPRHVDLQKLEDFEESKNEDEPIPNEQIDDNPELSEANNFELPVTDNNFNSSEVDNNSNLAELDAFQKLSELLETCQQKIKMNGEPFAKRQRQTYHFEQSFATKEEFEVWWESKKPEGLVHNSTYANNAGEKIDIYRCAKRDCQHRIRLVFNPVDGSVCVERSDAEHDITVHESKAAFTKESKAKITELYELGLKPKAIRTHFLQTCSDPCQIPTMTQIKNLVNRLKIKQKAEVSIPNTSFSFFDNMNRGSFRLVSNNNSQQI